MMQHNRKDLRLGREHKHYFSTSISSPLPSDPSLYSSLSLSSPSATSSGSKLISWSAPTYESQMTYSLSKCVPLGSVNSSLTRRLFETVTRLIDKSCRVLCSPTTTHQLAIFFPGKCGATTEMSPSSSSSSASRLSETCNTIGVLEVYSPLTNSWVTSSVG